MRAMASEDNGDFDTDLAAAPAKRMRYSFADEIAQSSQYEAFGQRYTGFPSGECYANNLYQQSYKSLDTLSPNYLQPNSPTPPLTMSSSLPESPEDSSIFDESSDTKEEPEDDDSSSTSSSSSSTPSDNADSEKGAPGSMNWVQRQIMGGINPRRLLHQVFGASVPSQLEDITLWRIIMSMTDDSPIRNRLRTVSSLDDVVRLLTTSSRIMVLTGAGVSVSCGIPDFRSHNGVYARLATEFPDLPDPQSMFCIDYFSKDPRPFFKFAREIYPGQFKPSPSHQFIKLLEKKGRLLRNYTQNIDTLEQVVGIDNVIECHGSFATASCTQCKHKVSAETIRSDVFEQRIPRCPICVNSAGIMKPDIVFFGEGLPDSFHKAIDDDKNNCDLLIVIGSSLKVRPVARIPNMLNKHVPQILINRERLPHMNFDVELLGDSDVIVDHLCRMLGSDWTEVCWCKEELTETKTLNTPTSSPRSNVTVIETVEGEMSTDSTRDSANSMSPPLGDDRFVPSTSGEQRHLSTDTTRDSGIDPDDPQKSSLAAYLPPNKYYVLKKRRYMFSGAEVDLNDVNDDSETESDSSEKSETLLH
ncbi:NAD-dependent protein deacetylase sirtuin-1 isoform X1 [Melanaphis sacchari]|uniref:NAD-dependent protein deacetylase sirtuin-1 isoform X1 n=2 Tax=Melanaphis sacchari TaxID=742174 RepID=UPI000DC153FD|nr:NAD-dependent protein deacetylase sirtuin-1 isoform X1 [Melanaphis sacchari]